MYAAKNSEIKEFVDSRHFRRCAVEISEMCSLHFRGVAAARRTGSWTEICHTSRRMGPATARPPRADHSHTRRSSPPDASRPPSPLKATARTGPACRPGEMSRSSEASGQRRTAPSSAPTRFSCRPARVARYFIDYREREGGRERGRETERETERERDRERNA